jgi:tetratricopeptide (TPR) repeat protein
MTIVLRSRFGAAGLGVVCALACADSINTPSHSSPIRKLIDDDHWKRARVLTLAQLTQNPRDPAALTFMSIIEESFNRWDSAKTYAEQAVAADPNFADGHAQLARMSIEIAETVALWKQVGLIRIMKRELDAAYRIDPNNLDAMLTDMMYTFRAPGIAGGSRARAHEIAQKLLRVHPEWGYMAEAKLAQSENNEPSAIRWLRDGGTRNYRIQSSLALVYCCLSPHPWHEEAIRIAKSLMDSDPTRVDAYALLVRSYAATGNYGELDGILTQAAQNVPDDLSPYYWAARTLAEHKTESTRAEAYLRRYLSQEPEGRAPTLGEAHWTLALILENEGRKPDAANEIRTAYKLRPDLEALKRDYKRLTD